MAIAIENRKDIDLLCDRCIEKVPEHAQYIKVAAFFWKAQNGDPLYAAEQLDRAGRLHSGTRDDGAIRVAQSSRGIFEVQLGKSHEHCVRYAKSIFDGREDIKQKTPEAYRLLMDYLGAHPMPEPEWAERETRDGCIKGQLNNGEDYDALVPMCECLGKAFVQATSAGERKAYWKAIGDNDPAAIAESENKFFPFIVKSCTAVTP
jgi:hypothetical protein